MEAQADALEAVGKDEVGALQVDARSLVDDVGDDLSEQPPLVAIANIVVRLHVTIQ